MDNRISCINEIPFGNRRMVIHNPEKFPKQIYNALQNSKAIRKFLETTRPKTFMDKIKSFFKKDEEVLNVSYNITNKSPSDPYGQTDVLNFSFSDGKEKKLCTFSVRQNGSRRRLTPFSQPHDRNDVYDPPVRSAVDRIARMLETIKDFNGIFI